MQKILSAEIGSSWPIKIKLVTFNYFHHSSAIIHHQSGLGEKKKWSELL